MLLSYAYLLLAIVVEIAATTTLKYTQGFTVIAPTVFCLTSYGVAFFLLSLVVKNVSVGVAYALWSGLGVIGTSIAAYFLFNQRLNAVTMIGMAIIVIGVCVMQYGTSGH